MVKEWVMAIKNEGIVMCGSVRECLYMRGFPRCISYSYLHTRIHCIAIDKWALEFEKSRTRTTCSTFFFRAQAAILLFSLDPPSKTHLIGCDFSERADWVEWNSSFSSCSDVAPQWELMIELIMSHPRVWKSSSWEGFFGFISSWSYLTRFRVDQFHSKIQKVVAKVD